MQTEANGRHPFFLSNFLRLLENPLHIWKLRNGKIHFYFPIPLCIKKLQSMTQLTTEVEGGTFQIIFPISIKRSWNVHPWFVLWQTYNHTSPSTKSSVGFLYEFMSMVAMSGQRRLMLCNATWWVRTLNAFVASTSKAASHSSDSKAELVACTPASMPEIWPSHIWRQPNASWISGAAMDRTALAMIQREVSSMPIGHIPGCLSRAMRWYASCGLMNVGST